jgi:enterochelin esterase-like enzyme
LSRALALVAIAALLSACGGGGDGGGTTAPAPSGQVAATFTVDSAHTGVAYAVTVYTPPGYAATTVPKAVIYALDHELQYTVVRDTAESLALDAIIVSVGNAGAARRFIDFDLPGAEAYQRFLTLELVPRVESQFRVDGTRRALVGYSLSGLAAMIVLLREEPSSRFFARYVMTDPSMQFHTNELLAAEQRLWARTHELPVTVQHCSTSGAQPFDTLARQIEARGYGALGYRFQVYPVSHAAVLGPCVSDGLRYVFGRG